MEILIRIWQISGIVALLVSAKGKKSILGEGISELINAKTAGDILTTLFAIMLIVPITIMLGPLTLLRFIDSE